MKKHDKYMLSARYSLMLYRTVRWGARMPDASLECKLSQEESVSMDKETVVFFLDFANINRTAREKRYRLDYHDLLAYVGEGRFLVDARCYVPINPRNE